MSIISLLFLSSCAFWAEAEPIVEEIAEEVVEGEIEHLANKKVKYNDPSISYDKKMVGID